MKNDSPFSTFQIMKDHSIAKFPMAEIPIAKCLIVKSPIAKCPIT